MCRAGATESTRPQLLAERWWLRNSSFMEVREFMRWRNDQRDFPF